MPQFLINPSAIKDNVAIITGGDAKHITQVLRLKVGDWLILTDGSGKRWRSEITSVSTKEVKAKLINLQTHQNINSSVTLAQAVIKHDRFEWIIQKSVELGCIRIIPFTSERTIPTFSSVVSKQKRWQKIADEAAKQCGTTIRPVVESVIHFSGLLERFERFEPSLLFFEGETKNVLLDQHFYKTDKLLIIIGPEGGFTSDEVEQAKEAGAITCGLGPLILRVETAALAALTLVQNNLGYFNVAPASYVIPTKVGI